MWEASQGIDGSARSSRLERLSSLDASNLRVEDHGLPMHATALVVFEGHPHRCVGGLRLLFSSLQAGVGRGSDSSTSTLKRCVARCSPA